MNSVDMINQDLDQPQQNNILLIGGTPGVGKTQVSELLHRRLGASTLHVNDLVLKHNLVTKRDRKRDTWIVDPEKLNQMVEDWLKPKHGWIILETHYLELLHKIPASMVCILRCAPEGLQMRLIKRGWSKAKIAENVQAEILGTCTGSARNAYLGVPVFDIDTTNRDAEQVGKQIWTALSHPKKMNAYPLIDWLTTLNPKKLHQFFNP